MSTKTIETRSKLITVALEIAANEISETHRLPGPNDDAEADYLDERLLEAAQDHVEASKDV